MAAPLCGAPRSSKATGTSPGRCRKPAGWRTTHPGFGRCRLHGGAGINGELFAARHRLAMLRAVIAEEIALLDAALTAAEHHVAEQAAARPQTPARQRTKG